MNIFIGARRFLSDQLICELHRFSNDEMSKDLLNEARRIASYQAREDLHGMSDARSDIATQTPSSPRIMASSCDECKEFDCRKTPYVLKEVKSVELRRRGSYELRRCRSVGEDSNTHTPLNFFYKAMRFVVNHTLNELHRPSYTYVSRLASEKRENIGSTEGNPVATEDPSTDNTACKRQEKFHDLEGINNEGHPVTTKLPSATVEDSIGNEELKVVCESGLGDESSLKRKEVETDVTRAGQLSEIYRRFTQRATEQNRFESDKPGIPPNDEEVDNETLAQDREKVQNISKIYRQFIQRATEQNNSETTSLRFENDKPGIPLNNEKVDSETLANREKVQNISKIYRTLMQREMNIPSEVGAGDGKRDADLGKADSSP